MDSPFAFVPRKVAKRPKSSNAVSTRASLSTLTTARDSHVDVLKDKGKMKADTSVADLEGKKGLCEEDYATLVWLSLSDHALWSDPDLRRTLEWNSKQGGEHPGKEGYIALSSLLRRSPVLSALHLEALEVPIAKAVRSCASDVLEIRMLISGPSQSTWFGEGQEDTPGGLYEIRRKDWSGSLEHPSREFSRADWEHRTLYMENIPPPHRSIPGIAQFTQSLLVQESKLPNHIESVTLPPHHQDKPGDQPKCKGFALVIVSNTEDVEELLRLWPWNRNSIPLKDTTVTDEVREAFKFGFRCLSKARWDELKDEYLAYRTKLLDEIIASEEGVSSLPEPPPLPRTNENYTAPADSGLPLPTMDMTSPYPLNCLVFVRSIHPETNKTTLRTLFSNAFKTAIANHEILNEGLDYVDFNKGMDSCYLRLTTPNHTKILTDHFVVNRTTQSGALDDKGTVTSQEGHVISMEIVQGKKEELYWQKVPEKVCRQAVQKALSQMYGGEAGEARGDIHDPEGAEGKGRRKRRKRDQ